MLLRNNYMITGLDPRQGLLGQGGKELLRRRQSYYLLVGNKDKVHHFISSPYGLFSLLLQVRPIPTWPLNRNQIHREKGPDLIYQCSLSFE